MTEEKTALLEKKIAQRLAEEKAKQALPQICGKYEKPKAKSTDRHHRETDYLAGQEVGVSATYLRYTRYIMEHASPEIMKAVDDGELKVYKAYQMVKTQKALELVISKKKTIGLTPEEFKNWKPTKKIESQ
jgi:hypothetical protein